MLEVIRDILAVIGGLCVVATFVTLYICCQWRADDELIENGEDKDEDR